MRERGNLAGKWGPSFATGTKAHASNRGHSERQRRIFSRSELPKDTPRCDGTCAPKEILRFARASLRMTPGRGAGWQAGTRGLAKCVFGQTPGVYGVLRAAYAAGVLLATVVLVSCAPVPNAREQSLWQQEEFLIGFHGAPPTDAAHYRRLADAGCTVLMGHLGPNTLDLAQRHGLQVAVSRIGMDVNTFASVQGRQRALRLLRQCRGHPALWGYYLGGEARAEQFADYGRLAAFVRECDAESPILIGLLPVDAWVGPQLRSADYAGYLQRFARAVRPDLLHAPVPDGPLFFEGLEHLRQAARDSGLRFTVELSLVDKARRIPRRAAEFRRMAFAALAYSASGVVWRGGLDASGALPPGLHDAVAAVNRDVRALGAELLPLRPPAVYHAGETVPKGSRGLPQRGPVGAVEGGSFLVGVFENGGRRQYMMVVNKDASAPAVATMVLHGLYAEGAAFSASSGRWEPLVLAREEFKTTLEVPLAAGGGRLLRLEVPQEP